MTLALFVRVLDQSQSGPKGAWTKYVPGTSSSPVCSVQYVCAKARAGLVKCKYIAKACHVQPGAAARDADGLGERGVLIVAIASMTAREN